MLLVFAGVLPCFAQDGKLAIHATPKQAYLLSTTGQDSAHQYPFKAEDFSSLVNRNGINKEIVQMAAEKKKIEN